MEDGWFHERNSQLWPGQAMSLKVEKVLYSGQSNYQEILVFDSTNHGRVLALDGAIQCTERDEFSYQEMITHIPIFSHPNPERICVIGGGDGGVLRELGKHSKDSIKEIILCEIDSIVIQTVTMYLPSMAIGFFDSRLSIHIGDGLKYLQEHENEFDVIIIDSSDPIGPASSLFGSSFYKAVALSLRSGGIMCAQAECIWLHLELIQEMMTAATEFFSSVEYSYTSVPTYPSGQIGFLLAGKDRGTSCKNPIRFLTDDQGKVMKYYSSEIHTASFILPAFASRLLGNKVIRHPARSLSTSQLRVDLSP